MERQQQYGKDVKVSQFKNPEWQKLRGREHRMVNQFGQTDTALDYQPKKKTGVIEKVLFRR